MLGGQFFDGPPAPFLGAIRSSSFRMRKRRFVGDSAGRRGDVRSFMTGISFQKTPWRTTSASDPNDKIPAVVGVRSGRRLTHAPLPAGPSPRKQRRRPHMAGGAPKHESSFPGRRALLAVSVDALHHVLHDVGGNSAADRYAVLAGGAEVDSGEDAGVGDLVERR